MRTKCCSCNSSGVCRKCACVKSNQRCTNCVPNQLGKCVNFDLPGAGSSAQTTGSISFLQPSFLRGVSKSSLSSCPPSFSSSCPTSSSCSPLASGANDPSSNQLMQPVVQVEEQVQTSESRLNESRAAAQQSSEFRSVVEDSACKKFVSNLLNKSTLQQKRVTRRCSASKCPAKSCDLAETSLGTTACPVQPQLTECAPPASHVHPSRTDALDQSTDQHGSSASSLPPPSFSGTRFTWGIYQVLILRTLLNQRMLRL